MTAEPHSHITALLLAWESEFPGASKSLTTQRTDLAHADWQRTPAPWCLTH